MKTPKVQDVMTKLVVKLYPKDPIRDAAIALAQNNISGAPVVQDKTIVGIVSTSDLIRAATPREPHGSTAPVLGIRPAWGRAAAVVEDSSTVVGEIMTRPVVTVSPEAPAWSAAMLMERHGVKRLPVADEDGKLVGIISRGDVVRLMAREETDIRADVTRAIGALGPGSTSKIGIWVDGGVVTLRGRADRRTTKEIAVRLARQVVGVTQVVDRLEFDFDDPAVEPVQAGVTNGRPALS
ncbi:MAG: CBS domain-containing protein [Actinomycetota bacterium]